MGPHKVKTYGQAFIEAATKSLAVPSPHALA
jgi:hypothetical protein